MSSSSLTLEELLGDSDTTSLSSNVSAAAVSSSFEIRKAVETFCDVCTKNIAVSEAMIGGVTVSICQTCLETRQQQPSAQPASLLPSPGSPQAGAESLLQSPDHLFRSFLIVGGSHSSGKSTTSLKSATSSPNKNHFGLSPDLLYVWPEVGSVEEEAVDRSSARLPDNIAQFCFPSGEVPVRRIRRSAESMASLLCGFDPVLSVAAASTGGASAAAASQLNAPDIKSLGPMSSAFCFVLSNSGPSATSDSLYACVISHWELLSRPPSLLSSYTAGSHDRQPLQAGDSQSFFVTQRCYVILSELPCFDIHFSILRLLVNQERLVVLAEFRQELSSPTALCERCGARSVAGEPFQLGSSLLVKLCSPCKGEMEIITSRIESVEQMREDEDEEEEEEEKEEETESDEGECVEEREEKGDENAEETGDSLSQPPQRHRKKKKTRKIIKRVRRRPRASTQSLISGIRSLLSVYWRQPVPLAGEVLSFRIPGEARERTLALPSTHSDFLRTTATLAGEFFLPSLVRQLPLDQFLQLLQSALLERRILIVSRDLSALSAAVLSVQALLQPFNWCGLLIPILPHSLQTFLDAPVPWIVGVPRVSVSRSNRDCVIFDLDVGKVSVQSDNHHHHHHHHASSSPSSLPNLPEGKKLRDNLRSDYDRLRASLKRNAVAGSQSHSPLSSTEEQRRLARAILEHLRDWHSWLLSKIRKHFSSIIELSGFLDSKGESGDEAKKSLVQLVSSTNRKYVEMFFSTQIFARFFDQFCNSNNKWMKSP